MKTILQKIFSKKLLRTVWIAYALFSVILVICLANNLICKDYNVISNHMILSNNWDISINGTLHEKVSLEDFSFDTLKKGDTIVMETTLPDNWTYTEPALCIHIRQTALNMYIDDTVVYQYGQDRLAQNKTVGSGIQLVPFSNDYKGRQLKLELSVTENRPFTQFDSLWLGEWHNLYRCLLTDNRLPLLLGCFLVVFGILVTLISIFAVTLSKKYASVLCLSIFSICIGLWTLCYHNVLIIFSIPLYSISLMEYMTLFLAPLPIIGYMYGYVKQLKSKGLMTCYFFLFGLQLILTVTAITLHTTDIAHGAALLIYFQIIFTCHSLFFTHVLRKGLKNNYAKHHYYTIGLLAVVVCIVYDLLNYCVQRYLGIKILNLNGISSLGIIIFLLILILDFYYDTTQKMMEEKEKALLIKLAYTDELTQINNRHFCTEYMNKIMNEHTSDYAIINFDLNGLKKANDTYGHLRGDILIQAAANVISDAFSSYGIVGRMGGDEFIAILKTSDEGQIKSMISALEKLIQQVNDKQQDLNLSISYGYATNHDLDEKNIEKVYQLADTRMYEYKRQYKLKHNKNLP